MSFSGLQVIVPRVWVRAGFLAVCSIGLVWFFSDPLADIDLAEVQRTISNYSWTTWVWATVFTFLSFLAISGYDPIINKVLGFDIPQRRAASIGWKATAVSQIVGFGLITGTVVRWLELGLNPTPPRTNTAVQAFKVTATVSACFLAASSLVAAIMLMTIYLSAIETAAAIFAVLALASILRISFPSTITRIRRFRREAGTFFLLTLIDTVFAALVIYLFLPTNLVPFAAVFAAFLLSFVVGLISGLPGGVGPFEICMIALLPSVDPAQLAPALVAFRVVYFAVPAVIALGLVGFDLLGRKPKRSHWTSQQQVPANLRHFAPPEQDLIADNSLACAITSDGSEGSLIMSTGRTIVQLGNPFSLGRSPANILTDLHHSTLWSKSDFSIYRCNRSTALAAKSGGMKTLKFSSEAIIRPRQFTLNIPSRSGLRRKIRKAAKLGVTINSQPVNLVDLTKIDAEWTLGHGKSRSFSTGTFSRDRIKRQRLYVAYQNNAAVGFVTFSSANGKWLLDIIRYKRDCPDGSIYSLITQAIEDARLNGTGVVSLGSVPFSPALKGTQTLDFVCDLIFRHSGSLKGLYQFKETFDPAWEDRYFASDTYLGGVRSAIVISKAIHRSDLDKTKLS